MDAQTRRAAPRRPPNAGAPKASLKLLFASNLAGSIIGKGGAGLAELRQYGIKAELARDEVLLAERMLAVEGAQPAEQQCSNRTCQPP